MRHLIRPARILSCSAALLFALTGPAAWAIDDAGTVKTVRGTATIERGTARLAVTPGFRVQSADRVRTGPDSAVGIMLRDQTMLTAGPNATMTLDQYAFNPTTHEGTLQASVQKGSLAVISGKLPKASPDAVRFKTSSVTLGVRGTSFIIDAAGEGE